MRPLCGVKTTLCLAVVCTVALTACGGDQEAAQSRSRTGAADDDRALSRGAAIERYWDEIKEELNGTSPVAACSSLRPNCDDLDAAISGGSILMVRFPNGGYLRLSADIDERGSAADTDQDGTPWEFTLDLDEDIVDEAIEAWARRKGFTIQ